MSKSSKQSDSRQSDSKGSDSKRSDSKQTDSQQANNKQARSPSQIESDLDRNRERMDITLERLQRKFSSGEMIDQTLRYVRDANPDGSRSNFKEIIVRNPLPVVLIGLGAAWLVMAGREGSAPPASDADEFSDNMADDSANPAAPEHQDHESATPQGRPVSASGPQSANPATPAHEKKTGPGGRDDAKITASAADSTASGRDTNSLGRDTTTSRPHSSSGSRVSESAGASR